jgi:MinD-like ATPase involved in chromosome partitioning or flagellar assembly
VPPPVDINDVMRANVIAVTSGRQSVAKRGVSASLAIALQAGGYGTTAVVDVDTTARDVAKRFSVTGPSFSELARLWRSGGDDDVLALLGRDPNTGCLVVPAGSESTSLDQGAYITVVERLRDRVDWLVIDAPPGLATASRPVDRIAPLLDRVLVTTSVDPAELSAAITATRAVAGPRGELVVVADAAELDAHRLTLQRKLRGLGDVVMLPRQWGRDVASPVDGEGATAPFAALIARMLARRAPQPA